jgi:hypothetical protein
MRRGVALGLATAVLTAAVVELACFAALRLRGDGVLAAVARRDWEDFVAGVPEAERERFRAHHHPLLGWDIGPDQRADLGSWSYRTDGLGSRVGPHPEREVRVSSYGDSFTFCTEVDDLDSWQAELARRTGTRVLNYGVPGYGTDQALLKLESHLAAGRRAGIVVLGINDSNIQRIMNAYVPFVVPRSPMSLGFKPLWIADGAGFRLIPNPLATWEDPLAPLRALARAKTHDWYYAHSRELHFPFAWAAAARLVRAARDGATEPSWKHRPSRRLMRFLVERFAELGRRHDFRPVVLLLPSGLNLRRAAEGREASYAPFRRELEETLAGEPTLLIDVLDEDLDTARFNVRGPYEGHASPYGNSAIATALLRHLEPLLRASPSAGTPTAAGPARQLAATVTQESLDRAEPSSGSLHSKRSGDSSSSPDASAASSG